MFQDRILTECWPHPQARGREGGEDEGGVEAEGVVPAARAADLATPAPPGGGNHLLRGGGPHEQGQPAGLARPVHQGQVAHVGQPDYSPTCTECPHVSSEGWMFPHSETG